LHYKAEVSTIHDTLVQSEVNVFLKLNSYTVIVKFDVCTLFGSISVFKVHLKTNQAMQLDL